MAQPGVRARRGQAAVEYVLAFAAFLVVIAVMGCLINATRRASVRSVALLSSDCP